MLNDPVLLQDGIENLQGTAAIDHEILGDNFEPIDDRLLLQDMAVVRDAQTDSDAVVGEMVESVGWHDEVRGEG